MKRYAILIGSIEPDEGFQKSILKFKDFLMSCAGENWTEKEIMITGPLPWNFVQLLQSRLQQYDYVVIYKCRFPDSKTVSDYSDKLKDAVSKNGIFICDECPEVCLPQEAGYEIWNSRENK
ncbi:MAG: hypothetical protein ACI4MA_01070 [Treponema sp.]